MFKKPRAWDNYLGYESENANDIFDAIDTGYNALFHRLFPKTVSQPLNRGGHRMDPDDVNGLLKIIAENILLFQRTNGTFEYNPEYEYPEYALVKFNGTLYLSIVDVPVEEAPIKDDKLNEPYWKVYSDDKQTINDLVVKIEDAVKSLTDAFTAEDNRILNTVESYKNILDIKDQQHESDIDALRVEDRAIYSRIESEAARITYNEGQISHLKDVDSSTQEELQRLRTEDVELQTQITELKNTDIEHDNLFKNLQNVDDNVNKNIELLKEVDAEYRAKLAQLDEIDTSVIDEISKLKTRVTNTEVKNSDQDDLLQSHTNSIDLINTVNNNQNTRLNTIEANIRDINTKDASQDNEIRLIKNSISSINGRDTQQDRLIENINDSITRINSVNNAQSQLITASQNDIKDINNKLNKSHRKKQFSVDGKSTYELTFNAVDDFTNYSLKLYVLDEKEDSVTNGYWVNSEGVATVAMKSTSYLIINDEEVKHDFLAVLI
jgi:hypothetical protein